MLRHPLLLCRRRSTIGRTPTIEPCDPGTESRQRLDLYQGLLVPLCQKSPCVRCCVPIFHIWPEIGNNQNTEITERRVYHRISYKLIRIKILDYCGLGLGFGLWYVPLSLSISISSAFLTSLLFLVHLSRRLKRTIVVTRCPLSVVRR